MVSIYPGRLALWPSTGSDYARRSAVHCGQNIDAFAETEVRAALINSLSLEVIQPLIDLKVRSLSVLSSFDKR